jgi:putative heme iron utilization protein
MNKFEQAQAAYSTFLDDIFSIILATCSPEGVPNASYAPFILDNDRNFYIYISGLSTHTQNLAATGKASIMAIKDEAQTGQLFARERLTFECTAHELERETPHWETIADEFADEFGKIISVFRPLTDFRIVQLVPSSGRFVIGFGAAYDVSGDKLDQLVQVTGEGKGHGS